MRLGAVYNVFDGVELLRGSMLCLKGHVDQFIIIWQSKSNYGEDYDPLPEINQAIEGFENVHLIYYEPHVLRRMYTGMRNEKMKRNIGIDKARELGCDYFLHIDVDEYYEDFGSAKQMFIDSGHNGSVCKMWTYFRKPTLRLEKPENYYVPFIHKLTYNTFVGPQYPFYVDRTRRVNQTDVIELPIMMHHFSWVRRDIERKCRNSSAHNLSKHLHEYESAEAGKKVFMYDQKLVEVSNIFNIDL